MKNPQTCIAIYSRKSKFTGKGESIGNQVELCKEYIRTHYHAACAETVVVYEDEGFSGGNLDRPAFQQMIAAARQHQFSAIVVYRLDRISRNISDFSGLIEELSRLNVAFVSIKEQFDTATPMGRAMMYIASVFSQLERETIAERIRDNMHELAKTGRWLGGNTPTGYTSESIKAVTVDGKLKKSCKLKLVPAEAAQVRLIFDLFLQTGSLTATEQELIRRRILTKNGKNHSRFSLRAILQNPVYLVADAAAHAYFIQQNADVFSPLSDFDGTRGILAYNRTNQTKGRSTVMLPIQEWIVAVGQHPGLIPSATWLHAQQLLAQNRCKSYRAPRINQALLTGFLFCSCGSRMYPKLSSRTTAEGKRTFHYVCKQKERSRGSLCHQSNANGILLDQAIFAQLFCLTSDSSLLVQQLQQYKKEAMACQTQTENELAALNTELTQTRQKIAALVDSLALMQNSAAALPVTQRIEELHAHSRLLEQQIQAHRQAMPQTKQLQTAPLLDFAYCLSQMSIDRQRNALRSLVHKIVWNGSTAHLFFLGSAE